MASTGLKPLPIHRQTANGLLDALDHAVGKLKADGDGLVLVNKKGLRTLIGQTRTALDRKRIDHETVDDVVQRNWDAGHKQYAALLHTAKALDQLPRWLKKRIYRRSRFLDPIYLRGLAADFLDEAYDPPR